MYWNSYETKPAKVIEPGKNIYKLLNASFQGVKRLFVFIFLLLHLLVVTQMIQQV